MGFLIYSALYLSKEKRFAGMMSGWPPVKVSGSWKMVALGFFAVGMYSLIL